MTTTFDDTTAAPADHRASGRRPLDVLMLAAVGIVVCLVSLPRLHGYVLGTNQVDARRAVELLGAALLSDDQGAPPDLGTALESDRTLAHRLRDARTAEDGSRLVFHGYYFELGVDATGVATIYAWPCEQGRTGLAAFACGPDGRLYVHANTQGRWSGEAAGPQALDLTGPGWRAQQPVAGAGD